eukprot:852568-Rhodomonas_salina.1
MLCGCRMAMKGTGKKVVNATGDMVCVPLGQREVASAGVLGAVHVLEEMASERQTGSLAEDLLSALTVGNEELREEVEGLRQATVEKKRERAAAQREKMLAEMGLSQGGGALAMHAKALGMDELDLEDEEDGQ